MTTLTRWAWENARILSDNACLNSFMLFFVSTHLFVCIFLRLERFIYFELLYMRIYILDVIQFHIFSSLVIYLDIWKSEHHRYKKDVFRNIQSCICQYVTVHFLPCVHMCVWNPKSAPVLPHCPLWCTNIHLASTKTGMKVREAISLFYQKTLALELNNGRRRILPTRKIQRRKQK